MKYFYSPFSTKETLLCLPIAPCLGYRWQVKKGESFYHSDRKLFTGLALAAFTA